MYQIFWTSETTEEEILIGTQDTRGHAWDYVKEHCEQNGNCINDYDVRWTTGE